MRGWARATVTAPWASWRASRRQENAQSALPAPSPCWTDWGPRQIAERRRFGGAACRLGCRCRARLVQAGGRGRRRGGRLHSGWRGSSAQRCKHNYQYSTCCRPISPAQMPGSATTQAPIKAALASGTGRANEGGDWRRRPRRFSVTGSARRSRAQRPTGAGARRRCEARRGVESIRVEWWAGLGCRRPRPLHTFLRAGC